MNYFYAGGPLFMTLISLAGLAALGFLVLIVKNRLTGTDANQQHLQGLVIAGSLAFILGLLGQAIGMYQAMAAIQQAGDVSPAMMAGGFQVSLIAPIYGALIFVITLAIRVAFHFMEKAPEN